MNDIKHMYDLMSKRAEFKKLGWELSQRSEGGRAILEILVKVGTEDVIHQDVTWYNLARKIDRTLQNKRIVKLIKKEYANLLKEQ